MRDPYANEWSVGPISNKLESRIKRTRQQKSNPSIDIVKRCAGASIHANPRIPETNAS